MNILITICARGGSKGLPGKNIKLIADKPLIAYSIETAAKLVETYPGKAVMTLSTDSEEIRSVASKYGLKTEYLRPVDLATDSISKTPALNDVLQYEEKQHNVKFDLVIDLDVTSPLRTVEDLTNAIKLIQKDSEAINLITVNPANRNPYFNMVEQQENGYYGLPKKLGSPIYSRQKAPKVYDMNSSFYIFRRKYFEGDYQGSLNNRTMIYEIPHLCFDVDSLDDFEYLEYLITSGKWTF